MAPVYKLSASSIRGRTNYGSMLAGNTAYQEPGDFQSISTVTVGSGGSSSIEFTSIPSTYTHLQIRAIGRVSNTGTVGNDNFEMRVNADSTAGNYVTHYVAGTGSSVQTGALTSSQTEMLVGKPANASSTTDVFGATIIDILDYASTNKRKTIRVLSGIDNNGSGQAWFSSGLWNSTNAITSLLLRYQNQNFVQYSHFALYGIKSA